MRLHRQCGFCTERNVGSKWQAVVVVVVLLETVTAVLLAPTLIFASYAALLTLSIVLAVAWACHRWFGVAFHAHRCFSTIANKMNDRRLICSMHLLSLLLKFVSRPGQWYHHPHHA